jgi:putative transposase
MLLTEQHIIKKSHRFYNECDQLCFKSKNLYNSGLFNVRQQYYEDESFLNGISLINKFTNENQFDYRQLPSKISQQTLRLVEQNFKSFFVALKSKKKNSTAKPVRIPKYLDKVKGRQLVTYTIQALSKTQLLKGIAKPSQTNIEIQTKCKAETIQQLRIVPRLNFYVIEIVYKKEITPLKQDNKCYASIDLGLNNLATLTSNVLKPIIINGKPLKSINQYYNKRLAKLKSNSKNKSTKRISRLHSKRNNKIKDYLHKSSRCVINHLVSNSINTLVIGYNKQWKQEINIGKVNNQNFVNVPHTKFIDMLKYKCFMEGINVIVNEESYTSKCSFLDNELIKKHEVYKGKRVKRGLFRSQNGTLINADVNGSLNILKKAVTNAFETANVIEVSSSPLVYSIKFN